MGNNIGLQVIERQSNTSPTLIPGDVGNVAMVVQSPLGPEGKVIPLNSLDNFRTIFGGPDTSFQSYYEIKGLFENAEPFGTNVYCVRSVDTGGVAASHEEGASPDTITFERAYLGEPSTGAKGNETAIQISQGGGETFSLQVYIEDQNGNEVLVETISGLSTDNIEGRVNNRSKFVRVTVTGDYTLAEIAKTNLAGGEDPTYPAEVSSTELGGFDNENVQLLFAPDYPGATSAQALEEYCAGRGDMLALASPELSVNKDNVKTEFSDTLLKAQSFLTGLFNWQKVDDGVGGDGLFTPAIGHVIGAYYIRKMNANGGHAFVPPAGLTISLRGIREQNQELTSADVETIVHDAGLNVIQFYRGYGFVVRTSRTMSTLDKHYSIHIRRSLNYLISSFRSQMGVFEQRQNNADTRRQLESSLTNFLFQEYQNGMFETIGGFEQNVGVVSNETNNDEQTRQARELVADVAMNFAEVAETVYVNLYQSDGQVSADIS